jgi:hypothetical protein
VVAVILVVPACAQDLLIAMAARRTRNRHVLPLSTPACRPAGTRHDGNARVQMVDAAVLFSWIG